MTAAISRWSSVRIAVPVACCVVFLLSSVKQTPAQWATQPAAQPAPQPAMRPAPQPPPQPAQQPAAQPAQAAQPQGTPFTAPDGTASVNVPAGYQVKQSGQGFIELAGPNGEGFILGLSMPATNGPFVPGAPGRGAATISMPYNDSFSQKLVMIIQQLNVKSGDPVPQVTISSVTPILVSPKVGQCGRFSGSATSSAGSGAGLGVLCSENMDSAGAFKNFLMLGTAPVAESAQFTPIAEAVMTSFTITTAEAQQQLAPFTQMAGRPKVLMDATDAQCFVLSVLRATSPSLLPRACGGSAAD